MATKTAQTEFRRNLRRKNAGKKSRRARENKGTTPAFPLQVPAAEGEAKAKK